MQVNLNQDWKEILQTELHKPYFKKLIELVNLEYQTNTCYPKKEEIFNAFNLCRLDKLKVVIIGQDPYHDKNQANGLCFSVNTGIAFPPSLRNIFKEMEQDVQKKIPLEGDLSYLAKQGVLLLNATLTVRKGEASSHQKIGWETFTNKVIELISQKKETIVFLLWGNFAKKKVKYINQKKHIVLNSGHPSPLSANRGYWFGNNHFSKTNDFLKKLNLTEIKW